jgi:hypothetical protein
MTTLLYGIAGCLVHNLFPLPNIITAIEYMKVEWV